MAPEERPFVGVRLVHEYVLHEMALSCPDVEAHDTEVTQSRSIQVEARSSFASMYKARIEFTAIICDHYCSNTNSYCKRLKVLCPEHTKEPKVSERVSEPVKQLFRR